MLSSSSFSTQINSRKLFNGNFDIKYNFTLNHQRSREKISLKCNIYVFNYFSKIKEEIQNREEETQFQYEDGMTEGRQDDLPDLLEDAPEKERKSSSPDTDGLPDLLANAPDEKRISAFPDRDDLPDALEDTPEEEERMAACL